MMNTNSKNVGAVELLILAVMLLAWACMTVVRTLVVPLVALAVVQLTRLRRTPTAPIASDEAAQPAPEPAQPVLPAVSLSAIAAELEALPAAHLRAMAGTRRRASKRELTALICAMPI